MKYSKIFAKTNKSAKEFDSINATLLQKAGFIDQVMAGVYTFLPLGLRVLTKIEKIVREEMDKIGSEIFMPAIVPSELWETTGRKETVDVLFKVSGANEASIKRNNSEYILNCTHEDVVTPLAQKFALSYKDLPFATYQIQTKFRNEARAKSGLLRGREFRMKDLYSFHTTEADLLDYYHNKAKVAYTKVYERIGLGDDTVIALASGGDFTKEFSHEFQTKCESGEDLIFYSKKENIYYNKEVTPSKAVDLPQDKEMKEMESVFGENIKGVEDLAKFLNMPVEKSVKTLLYVADGNRFVAVGVRGDYEVDELKLKKVLGCSELSLATDEIVIEKTGAIPGYAGLIGLKDDCEIIADDSIENLVNFECGANKTNYHNVNVNWGRDLNRPEKFFDVKVAKAGDICPTTGEPYEVFKACEVGNIFPLMTKFSKLFKYNFTDQDGKQKLVYMGCYGIGTSRAMGVIVEKYHDDKGMIWPMAVAPYHVHIVSLGNDENVLAECKMLQEKLEKVNIEVLWDDRDENTGAKLNDADLIGIPIRVIVSKRSIENGGYEVKMRNEEKSEIIAKDKVLELVKGKI